jgi:ribosomal protein L31E
MLILSKRTMNSLSELIWNRSVKKIEMGIQMKLSNSRSVVDDFYGLYG